jgi:hypothetical protein
MEKGGEFRELDSIRDGVLSEPLSEEWLKTKFANTPLVNMYYPEQNLNPHYIVNFIPEDLFNKLSSEEKLIAWQHGSKFKEGYKIREPEIKNVKLLKLRKSFSPGDYTEIEFEIFGSRHEAIVMNGTHVYPKMQEYDTLIEVDFPENLIPAEILERYRKK